MKCCFSRTCGFTRKKKRTIRHFAKQLAALCDIYVNDAFGTAHRAHASTAGIAHSCNRRPPAFLMQKELEALSHALTKAEKPYVAIVGGAKISDKIELIENFLNLATHILIGGAMAYTFLRARGLQLANLWSRPTRSISPRELLSRSGVKRTLRWSCRWTTWSLQVWMQHESQIASDRSHSAESHGPRHRS